MLLIGEMIANGLKKRIIYKMKSRAKTEKETKMEILEYIRNMKDYWKNLPSLSLEERLHGLVFSVLVMLDGESSLPAMDIVMSPNPNALTKSDNTNDFNSGIYIFPEL